MKKVAIIGGGILGLSIGYKLATSSRHYKVTIFEKESEVGCHQSGRNSGVLHCGLSYEPNSLKAQLAVEGVREMIAFCRRNEVNFEQCGKIVVATNQNEDKILQDIAIRGKTNGLKNLKFLNKNEIHQREPNIVGINALLVPEEGIVDYKGVMLKLVELIKVNNGEVIFNAEITDISFENSKSIVRNNSEESSFDLVINCAGLHSDRVFKNFSNTNRPIRIVPFRGEYMRFKDEYRDMINHLVYPVPNPKYPFLGVHFTRMINGDREVGPNAVLALKREGYKSTDFSVRDTIDILSYRGLHNFIGKNFNFALGEFSSSISKKSFINKARIMMPDISDVMLNSGTSGVRAQAMSPKGELLMDFKIEKMANQIHILNAPSPGATASLAIANYIINNFIDNGNI